jgi:glycosyltransferase involved in cell wall biosynthesis
MKVAFYVPRWRESHGGAQLAMIRLARGMTDRGHDVSLYHNAESGIRRYGRVYRWNRKYNFDAVMCAGGIPEDRFSRHSGAVIRNVHHSSLPHWAPYGEADGIVWCSETHREHYYARGVSQATPNIVSYPMIYRSECWTEPGDRVTMINPMPQKGGDLFVEIAEAMPDVRFLAVEGGWNRDVQIKRFPSNVETMDYQRDIRHVWNRTRVLLYPLGKTAPEDWIDGAPMAPLEAACAGIPTIATPQPGIVETIGGYAKMVEGHDPAVWAEAITEVLNNWPTWSKLAHDRAAMLDPDAELTKTIEFVEGLI